MKFSARPKFKETSKVPSRRIESFNSNTEHLHELNEPHLGYQRTTVYPNNKYSNDKSYDSSAIETALLIEQHKPILTSQTSLHPHASPPHAVQSRNNKHYVSITQQHDKAKQKERLARENHRHSRRIELLYKASKIAKRENDQMHMYQQFFMKSQQNKLMQRQARDRSPIEDSLISEKKLAGTCKRTQSSHATLRAPHRRVLHFHGRMLSGGRKNDPNETDLYKLMQAGCVGSFGPSEEFIIKEIDSSKQNLHIKKTSQSRKSHLTALNSRLAKEPKWPSNEHPGSILNFRIGAQSKMQEKRNGKSSTGFRPTHS